MISWDESVLKEADLLLKRDSISYRELAEKYSNDFGVYIHPEGLRGAIRRWRNRNLTTSDKITQSFDVVEKRTKKYQRDYIFDNVPVNGVIRFGAMGDTHLGSKYECLEELHDMYQIYKAAGVTAVIHAGNYIEGDAPFNKQDVLVRGVDGQCKYFIDKYPRVPGIDTFYIGGDDHEGWFLQREGIDVGERLEDLAHRAGRNDLHYLGYMEKDLRLFRDSDEFVRVIHPGGGSAKAISYTSQGIVDTFQPYEKFPTLVLAGHYHKAEFLPDYKGTAIIQTGTFQDQSPFMRKKRLSAHIGGWIVTLRMNEGRIQSIGAEFIRFRPTRWEYK